METLTVARERTAFESGAVKWDENTTAIMLDILEAAKKPSNITRYTKILESMEGMYVTTVPKDVITSSAKWLLNEGWSIKTQTIDGANGTEYINSKYHSVQYPNQGSVNKCSSAIKALNK